MSSSKLKFLKPADSGWEEDAPEVQERSQEVTSVVYNPHVYLSLREQREKLPVYANRTHIIYLLEKYQTLVLVGETGCGKSTQVPQYLQEAGWASDGRIIGVTEPRRVAAIKLAERVAEESGATLGRGVGYSIRFDDCWDKDHTKIKFLTEGILVREMMADPLLRQYSVLILDEVHERTMYTDIILGLLKKILKRRPDLRLVVASATVDAEHLRDFFNLKSGSKNVENTSSSILSIQGRQYPVDIFYVKDPVPDYVKASVETVVKIHETERDGDILVFLTGQDEVQQAVSLLREHAENFKQKGKGKLWPLPMYANLPAADQLKVFRSSARGTRKVVVATNITEASVTISGISYVVDCGFVKLRWYDPTTDSDSLVVIPTSKASAQQRAGRAGRMCSGKAYRLYTEESFSKLNAFTPPEIQRSDLSLVVLQLKAMGIDNVLRFNFPSPPPANNLANALEMLFALGAIDDNGDLTNPLGQQMAELSLEPKLSRMLLISGEYGCYEEVLSIVAMIQVQNVFVSPPGQGPNARIAKRKFEVEEGDHLTLFNVYDAFIRYGMSKAWCSQNFLNQKTLKRAVEIRGRLDRFLKKFEIGSSSCGRDVTSLLKCITASLFPHAAYLHYSGEYRTVRGNHTMHVHPTSSLYTCKQPQWVVFSEVLNTDKAYMKGLTVVKPEWLEEVAPHFYHRGVDKDH